MARTLTAGMTAALATKTTRLNICWAIYRNRDRRNITGFSSASNVLVTVDYPHGLSVGDSVQLDSVGGVSAVHLNNYVVQTVPSTTTFTLNYDSSLDAYTSGGVMRKAFGFTNSDTDITYENITYKAKSGSFPTRVKASGDASVGNMEITTLLVEGLTKDDVWNGVWDSARTEIFLVNVADLADGAIPVIKGWIGNAMLDDSLVRFEIRDLMQALQQRQGEVVTPMCRNDLGDTRCGVDLTSYDDTGSITTLTSQIQFTDSAATAADGYFTGGKIRFTTGNNAGYEMDIIKYASKEFTLAYRLPKKLAATDQYVAFAGCDKAFSTCKATFSNGDRFRGEPHVPLTEKVSKYGSNV